MSLDLRAYFDRVAFRGRARADAETLRALHRAHVSHVPFENLDVQLGLPIKLDVESLQDKLVRRRRGGYCFEQNTLFLAVLREIGFDVEPYEARVRAGTNEVRPRTHMLLCVALDEGRMLADVGFGGEGPSEPVAMDGTVSQQAGRTFRVVPEGHERVLQSAQGAGWDDLYVFEAQPRHPVDYEMANYYTSTHPTSRFVQTLTVQLSTPEGRFVLRGRVLQVFREGALAEEHTLEPGEAYALLAERFGLELPAGTRLRAFDER